MGLDMYFTRQPKTNSTVDPHRYSQEVGYFRKHNALHQWLVTHAQNGVDMCDSTELSQELLTKCANIVENACILRDGSLLPPSTEGYFFGSSAVDEWYWSQMVRTHETLQYILHTTDWKNESVYYQSSW
jgi:hypothetical protein